MATDGIEGTLRAYMFIGLAVLGTVVLYTFIAGVAWGTTTMVRRFAVR
jgi:hypothetical protein